MKRATFRIMLFLLLGAIVNVLVAWSIGFDDGGPLRMMSDWEDTSLWINEGGRYWRVSRRHNPGTFVLESWRRDLRRRDTTYFLRGRALEEGEIVREGVDPSRLIPYWLSDFAVPTEKLDTARYYTEYRTAIAHGWPCLVTWRQGMLRIQDRMYSESLVILGRGSWEIPFMQPTNGVQPSVGFFPIWHGVIVNTIFYGAILWLLTLGPFTARRMIRHKRGLCTNCGYDLRHADHPVCPECGATP